MQAMVIGWSRTHGTGKESGQDYDMGRVNVLVGLSPVDKPSTKRECAGFKMTELEANLRGITALKKLNGVTYPQRMELTLENEMRFVGSGKGGKEVMVGIVVDAKPL